MLKEHCVKGFSMYPLLKPGQRVVLDLQPTEFKKGDVVAFFVSAELVVLHRVLAIDGDTLICKGDSNSFVDSPVAKDTIYGVLNMVRLGAAEWKPAADYQKSFYMTGLYSSYAQYRKKLLFLAYRVKRLFAF
jgi:signal peptidase I